MNNKLHKTKISDISNTFIFLLVFTVFLPWPHGGELIWQYLFFTACLFLVTGIFLIKNITNNNNIFTTLTHLKAPLSLLVIWLLYHALQIIPLPISLLDITHQNLKSSTWQTISIDPSVTLFELIKHTSYITIFILSLILLNTKKRIIALAQVIFFGSTVIALYSLINHYTQGEFNLINSLPPWTISWDKATHGTFSYQNHYASFLTLTIPLGYGLIYINIKNKFSQHFRVNKTRKLIDLMLSINGLYILSLIVMVTALLKTASRGGTSIFILSIVITFICLLLAQKQTAKTIVKKVLFGLVTLLVIVFMLIASGITDSLTNRFETTGYNPNGRMLMQQTAITIISKRPIVGTGAGTYPIIQHQYKAEALGNSTMSKRAHNDYLELLANQGLIGFTLLGLATTLLLIKLFKGLQKRRRNTKINLYGLQVGCFCAAIAILLHSLADFNFHLPVNAVYFYLIVAIGIKSQQITH